MTFRYDKVNILVEIIRQTVLISIIYYAECLGDDCFNKINYKLFIKYGMDYVYSK